QAAARRQKAEEKAAASLARRSALEAKGEAQANRRAEAESAAADALRARIAAGQSLEEHAKARFAAGEHARAAADERNALRAQLPPRLKMRYVVVGVVLAAMVAAVMVWPRGERPRPETAAGEPLKLRLDSQLRSLK